MSDAEHATIVEGKAKSKVQRPVPWRRLLSSGPVWAIVAATFGNMCGVQFLIYFTPDYLKVQLCCFGIESGFSKWFLACRTC